MIRELIKAFLNNLQINWSLTALMLHVQCLYIYEGFSNKTAPHSLGKQMVFMTGQGKRRQKWWVLKLITCSPMLPPLHMTPPTTLMTNQECKERAGIQVTAGWSEDRDLEER
jgi:hypothetical protein